LLAGPDEKKPLALVSTQFRHCAGHGVELVDTPQTDPSGIGNFRKQILQPVDQLPASQPYRHRGKYPEHRRVSLCDNKIALMHQTKELSKGTRVERQVIERATDQIAAPELRGPDSGDCYTLDTLIEGKSRRRVVIALPAGNDMDFSRTAGKMESKIG
jgi:hypothetical protein